MNDERPDPHLRAALRHAPDADLQAPAAIGERLRAAARAAVAADRPAPWWRALWPTTPLRLGASGAFASVLLAGVIGLLWRGEPPPAVAPAPAAAPPAAAPPATATPAAPPPAGDRAEARAKALGDAVQQQRSVEAQREVQQVERQAAERTARAAPTPVAPTPIAPRPAVPPAVPAAAPPPITEAAKAEPAAAPAMSAPAPEVVGADRARRAASPAAAELSRTAGLAAPAASAADAWRRELDRVVGDRWRALDGTPPLALRRIGNAEVGVDATRAYLCEATPRRCREAELTADEARRLRESLPP